ncbi:CBF-domain-containing protein [Atractiella rhizophila]|nr:CBF-domain-containing protein [Atractiella rhizophila]
MLSDDANAQEAALSAHLTLLQVSSRTTGRPFPSALVSPLIPTLLSSSTSLQSAFTSNYLDTYDDIRHFFLSEASKYTGTLPNPSSEYTSVMLQYLEGITTMPDDSSELNEWWGFDPATSKRKGKGKKRALSREADKERKTKKRKVEEQNVGATGIFDDEAAEEMLSDSEEEPSEDTIVTQEEKEDVHPLLELSTHRKSYTQYFYALLGTGLDEDQMKRLLVVLHSRVLPNLTHVTRLMDWLADCTDRGGTVALLALNALYLVMSKNNLDYPNFFPRVYALLDRKMLHSRYRTRFLNLLDLFLTSSHLTSSLVAAFIKRLSRLSLNAPTGAIVLILPFVYNLLKRHPKCEQLIHRVEGMDGFDKDPFDMSEPDPLNSHALESSIWELVSMKKHFWSSIASLSKMFEEKLTKPNYELEDFADHSYASMFAVEVNRPIKKPPALSNLTMPGEAVDEKSFFAIDGYDSKASQSMDAITDLWSF